MTGFKARAIRTLNTARDTLRPAFADHYTLLLMLITSAGFFLRIYHLGYPSVSMDEAVDLFLSTLSISDIWAYIANGFVFHPPLFYWLQHFILMLGTGEFIMRLLPVLYGTLTIPVLYLLGKEFNGRDVGILTSALLAFSPFHIFYSQDARPYSMMLLFCSVALVYFVRAIKTDSGGDWAMFGIFSGLSVWIVFFSLVLTLSLLIYVVIERWGRIIRGFDENRAMYVGGIFFLIVIMPLGGLIRDLFLLRAGSEVTWGLRGLDIVTESYLDFYSHNELSIIVTIILAAIGIVGMYRYDPEKCALLLTILIIPVSIMIAISFKLAIEPRYALIVLPALFVSIAVSSSALYSFITGREAVSRMDLLLAFLVIFAAISIPPVLDLYSTPVKFNQDWRNMSATVTGMTGPGDVVVVLPPYMNLPFNYYYSGSRDATLEVTGSTVQELEQAYALSGGHRMIVVEDANHESPPMQWVLAHGSLYLKEGEVSLYQIE